MKVQSLDHVVLKAGNSARSETFFNEILGLPIFARLEKYQMIFFSLCNHHDFAIAAVGEDAAESAKDVVGLQHVAFKISDDLDALR
jgi:catechol-2,3-dioxygenase